jgi:endonuclease YncB( thermonuclease family)
MRMRDRGNRVKLIRDRSQDNHDAYDRLLRYVERSGRDIGRKQVRKGWAKPYVFESPFRRLGSYRRYAHLLPRSDELAAERVAAQLSGGRSLIDWRAHKLRRV